MRDRRFLSIDDLNDAIAERVEQLNNRTFQKMSTSRRELFEQIDSPALRALPTTPYDFAHWSKARVNIDYHIAVDKVYYSVPYTLIKKEVEVRTSARVVEVLYKGQRVASHVRSFKEGKYSTVGEHMPKAHQAYVDWDPQRLVRWAAQTGPATAALVERLLESRVHPQQGYRACLGLIRLNKIYGKERLEAACARAGAAGAISYRSVKSILVNKLDTLAVETIQTILDLPAHSNIRGPGYYS
jgi:transposase